MLNLPCPTILNSISGEFAIMSCLGNINSFSELRIMQAPLNSSRINSLTSVSDFSKVRLIDGFTTVPFCSTEPLYLPMYQSLTAFSQLSPSCKNEPLHCLFSHSPIPILQSESLQRSFLPEKMKIDRHNSQILSSFIMPMYEKSRLN